MMNDEDNQDLKIRTKAFAIRVICTYSALPRTTEAQVLWKQVLDLKALMPEGLIRSITEETPTK